MWELGGGSVGKELDLGLISAPCKKLAMDLALESQKQEDPWASLTQSVTPHPNQRICLNNTRWATIGG